MISIEEIFEVHNILIGLYGGSQGVRDINTLRSALQRPYQTFDGKELYDARFTKQLHYSKVF